MEEGNEPRIFLDSNVILDVIERRRNESIALLECIKEKDLFCCTSSFAHAELVDIEQEFTHVTNMLGKRLTLGEILRKRREKRLTLEQREDAIDRVRSFFKQYKIETWELDEKGWSTIVEIMRDLNVKAPDSIHIATAVESSCTIFVTNDKELGKEVKKIMKWVTPKQAFAMLQDALAMEQEIGE